MNDIDRRIVECVVHDIPFTAADYRVLGQAGPIGQAALLLGTDETAIESWYRGFRGEATPMSRVLSRAVDTDEVVDAIDATLGSDPRVLEDLARASVTWTHDVLPSLLEQDEFRVGAAWMLCQTDSDAIEAWLDGQRSAEAIAEVARVAGQLGCEELFDAFASWAEAMEEAEPADRNRFDAALFLMSPTRWSRLFLRGEWSGDWLGDRVAVADVLSVHANSYFGGMLTVLWDDRESFALMARFAAAGVAANLAAGPEDDLSALLDALDAEDHARLLAHPAMTVAAALADDEELVDPLVEAAAHDLLFAHGEDSPGIEGFPLSPTFPTPAEVEVAERLLLQAPDEPKSFLAVVATLIDLAMVAPTNPGVYAPVLEAARALESDERKAVARAARRVFDRTAPSALKSVAAGEDIKAYGAAEQIGRDASEESLLTLIELWSGAGSVVRTSLYSALVFDELRRHAAL